MVSTLRPASVPSSTDPNVHFDKVRLPNPAGRQYLGRAIGPDEKLYASTTTGEILRYPINPNGTLGEDKVSSRSSRTPTAAGGLVHRAHVRPLLDAPTTSCSGSRDPRPRMKMRPTSPGRSHSSPAPNLSDVQDRVIHLPRAGATTSPTSPCFGPDARSTSGRPRPAAWRPDLAWGNRSERLLSAAILRLTPPSSGPAPRRLTRRGRQIQPLRQDRAADDLRNRRPQRLRPGLDSNGNLYAPANGSATGGNTPAGASGMPPIGDVAEPETDYLFRLRKGWLLRTPQSRRATRTSSTAATRQPAWTQYEIAEYPVGTKPDANWQPAAFDMGMHESPRWASIEYHGNARSAGRWKGKLLVVRTAAATTSSP